MGLILDSSVLIAGERRNESIRQILSRLRAKHGETVAAISVVTVVELAHGLYRAKTESDRVRRKDFVEDVYHDLLVYPIGIEIAQLAGRIEGEQMAQGISIAFQDLLIGATALNLGFELATLNIRHFQKIPDLKIVSPFF